MGGFQDELLNAHYEEGGQEEYNDYVDDDVEEVSPPKKQKTDKEEEDKRKRKDILNRLSECIESIYAENFFLTPFGSSVNGFSSESSDFDLALLLPGKGADEKGNSVRSQVVIPTLQNLSRVLRTRDFKLKEFVRNARVPIVALEDNKSKIPADVSVNQPYGILNSWLLRDYAHPSVVEIVLKVKNWAKSKELCNARFGYFSSYGWTLLTLGFLLEKDYIPVMYEGNAVEEDESPFLDCEEGLKIAVEAVEQNDEEPRPHIWWKPVIESFDCDDNLMADLFQYILDHLEEDKKNPRERKLVSIRKPGQNDWDELLKHTKKKDHWQRPVYAVIEEPFSGENVGRVLRPNGHSETIVELKRALRLLEAKEKTFEELIRMEKFENHESTANIRSGQKRPIAPRTFPAPQRRRTEDHPGINRDKDFRMPVSAPQNYRSATTPGGIVTGRDGIVAAPGRVNLQAAPGRTPGRVNLQAAPGRAPGRVNLQAAPGRVPLRPIPQQYQGYNQGGQRPGPYGRPVAPPGPYQTPPHPSQEALLARYNQNASRYNQYR